MADLDGRAPIVDANSIGDFLSWRSSDTATRWPSFPII